MDTSVLVAACLSDTGGARQLLRLGEFGVVPLVVGPAVVGELDRVLRRKAPSLRPLAAVLLDAAQVEVSGTASEAHSARAAAVVDYAADAVALAEALTAEAVYLVSLDRARFVGNPRMAGMPLQCGTPGDCLKWIALQLA